LLRPLPTSLRLRRPKRRPAAPVLLLPPLARPLEPSPTSAAAQWHPVQRDRECEFNLVIL